MNKLSTVILAVLTLCSGTAPAPVFAQNTAQQGLYKLPDHLYSLIDLGLLDRNKNLSAAQKTEVYVSWLAQERAHPSPVTEGLGGGPIDSSYIQAQIIKGLAEWGDPLAVQWVADSSEMADEGVRDAMFLALGRMGDISQTPNLMRILANNPNPRFRALAAEDLGDLGAVEALPLLKQMQFDNSAVSFESHNDIGPPRGYITVHPVLGAVRYALQVLQSPADLQEAKTLKRQFVDQLSISRTFADAHHLSPARFIAAANSGRLLAAKGKLAGK